MRRLAALLVLLLTVPACADAQTSKYGIPSTNGAGAITPPVSTVAQLPTCDVSHIGFVRYVLDANAPTFNATVTGGSTTRVLVVCNGTNWTAN